MMASNVRYAAAVLVMVLLVANCSGKPAIAEDYSRSQMTVRSSYGAQFTAAFIFGGILNTLDRIGLGFLIPPILGIFNSFFPN